MTRTNEEYIKILEEKFIGRESLFFKDCEARDCVYNLKGICRCRNIGSECQGYKASGEET